MGYATGDTVVHPQHGTATVAGMVEKDLGSGTEKYLTLRIEAGSLTIMVPATAVDAVGIRDLSTRGEAESILGTQEEASEIPQGWWERNVITMSRIKSHELEQIAMVVRDLSRHQQRIAKPLTKREWDLLTACLDTVAKELSIALDMSEKDTKDLLVEKSLNGTTLTD